MLESPNIPEEKIEACLSANFGLTDTRITFLPLGADLNSAVYHIETTDQESYFFKVRSGPFNKPASIIPNLLHEQGIDHVIPQLLTQDHRLWATLDGFNTILYPFIEGKNGYEIGLSDNQWIEFGATMKRFHTAVFPKSLTDPLPTELYSPKWRQMVMHFLGNCDTSPLEDSLASDLAHFLMGKRSVILELVETAESLAATLEEEPPEFIVCHADIHAGNIHLTDDGKFYIIDWDTLRLAPKERDLMSIGGGLMGDWRNPWEEEQLFYRGYGPAELNKNALTYYRCERIIEDLAIECHQIFNQEGIIEDRQRSLYYLKSNFQSGGTIELALL